MNTLEKLRQANLARSVEWEAGSTKPLSLIFFANELGGEVGEACNVLKKLDREFTYKIRGSRSTIRALAEELADIIICCDLVAMTQDIYFVEYATGCWPEHEPLSHEFNADFSNYGASLMASAGRVCDIALHYQSHINNSQLASVLCGLVTDTKVIADQLTIDLDDAVRGKFNATSFKLNLKTVIE